MERRLPSGEEAYTIAILLAEALGPEDSCAAAKVYATDVDEEALSRRAWPATSRSVSAIPPHITRQIFDQTAIGTDPEELRRGVIFGRHDLLQDAPISRVDLLLCRNTIMYFGAEAQARILERLHFALNEGGVLFLGKAEMLLTQANLFAPFELKRRIFLRLPRVGRDRTVTSMVAALPFSEEPTMQVQDATLAVVVFETSPVAQLIIDGAGVLVMANEAARNMMKLDPRDTGRRFYDLEISYRPVELRAKIEEAYGRRRKVEMFDVEWPTPAGTLNVDILVTPRANGATNAGVHIALVDITRFKGLQQELRKSHQEIESAYEELQSTSEELETTNEERQSTLEELEPTNQALQSTTKSSRR